MFSLHMAVIWPNGFFNDMSEFLKMAKRGTVYQIEAVHVHSLLVQDTAHFPDQIERCIRFLNEGNFFLQ